MNREDKILVGISIAAIISSHFIPIFSEFSFIIFGGIIGVLVFVEQFLLGKKIWQWLKIIWPILLAASLISIIYPGLPWLDRLVVQAFGDSEGVGYSLFIFAYFGVIPLYFAFTIHPLMLWRFGRKNNILKDVVIRTGITYLAVIFLITSLYIYDFPSY